MLESVSAGLSTRRIMGNEAEAAYKGEVPEDGLDVSRDSGSLAAGADDVAIIPKGVLDPVYEAKARVLNRAVCPLFFIYFLSIIPLLFSKALNHGAVF